MKRQLDDYFTKFYNKLGERHRLLAADKTKLAKEMAAWKEEVVSKWDSIEVLSIEKSQDLQESILESGQEYEVTIKVDEKGLKDAIGIELVLVELDVHGREQVYAVKPLEVINQEGDIYTFHIKFTLSNAGSYRFSYRMYPKNENLPHRQDFCYVRWFR